jgi:hypothetical protein
MKTKKQKQEEALARQAAFASLPIEAQIERVKQRPGESKRQRALLLAKIEVRGKVTK